MAIIRQIPWTQQPQDALGVDFGSSFARGLAFAINGSTGLDELSGKALARFNGVTQRATPAGLGIQTDGVNDYLSLSIPTTDFRAGTLIWVGVSPSPATDCRILSLGNTGNTDRYFAVGAGQATASKMRVVIVGDGGVVNTNQPETTNSVFSAGVAVAALTLNGLRVSSYVNGVADSFTNSYPSGGSVTCNVVGVGALLRTSAVTFQSGATIAAFGWTRALSDAEIAEFSANPWQLFAPRTQRIWTAAATGGAFKPAWARNRNSIISGVAR